MQKTIKEYTVIELKAIAYDAISRIERAQIEIKAINEELVLRQQETPVENV